MGPVGFIVLPYMMLLGFPSILLGYLLPDSNGASQHVFLVADIVNYVLMSYLVGEFAGRLFPRGERSSDAGSDAPAANGGR